MENEEEINVEEHEIQDNQTTHASSIVVDIEQGKAYDMDKDFKQVGKSTLYFLIIQFVVAFVMVFVMSSFMIGNMVSSDLSQNSEVFVQEYIDSTVLWISIITSISAFVSGYIVVRSAKKKMHIVKEELRRKNPWDIAMVLKYTVIAMGLSIMASFVVLGLDMIMNLFGLQLTTPDFSLTDDVVSNIFMLLAILVAAPIFEELLCRGVILRTLQRYNTRFAIIVSSIIFGLLHMNFIQGLPAFAMGLVFAYVSVKANSVIPSMIMHFINNAIAVLMAATVSTSSFVEIGFIVIQILMMLFAVYYIVSHRTQFSQDADLMISAKGYYIRFFSCWPNVVLITICSLFTIVSFVFL